MEITNSNKNDIIQPHALLNVANKNGAREFICIRIIESNAHIGCCFKC